MRRSLIPARVSEQRPDLGRVRRCWGATHCKAVQTTFASHSEAALSPPRQVTPYSELGVATERLRWWAPLGWLLVVACTVVLYAVALLLSPLLVAYVVVRRLAVRRRTYHRRPEDLRIAVVGAGWAGLQCLDRLRTLGVGAVDVYERHGRIGGTWSPDLRYHGLQIHASMTVTSFAGFPYSNDPDVQGGKVMAEEVERYIQRYAAARDLLPHVQLGTHVDALDCDSSTRTATLHVTDTTTGETWSTAPYDLVIWASMAAYGDVPALPGAADFRGRQLHTTDYTDAEFEQIVREGKRAVVVGGGKAACDVVLGLRRAGYDNFTWLMRKPYLFYKYESLLHPTSALDRLRGVSYLATLLWTGLSRRFGALLHWGSGYLWTFGAPHRDFTHFHGGVLCPTQRAELRDEPYVVGNPVAFTRGGVVLADGRDVPADVVIWATGNRSGIDTLRLRRDGRPFALDAQTKLFNHFVVPELPVLASSTALWTVFGPMRATNAAELAVYHLCVRSRRTEEQMRRAARRQLSDNSLLRSFIWAKGTCWLQQWVRFHIDLLLQGITPLEAFLKHALEVFVLGRETPLEFALLPRAGRPDPVVRPRRQDRRRGTTSADADLAPLMGKG